MGGCTAVKCSNTRSIGFRLLGSLGNRKRRKTWLQNCRRDKWQPTNYSELCEIHFEEGQFEQHRQDDLKKLKPNAIPTLFDIPNPPRLLETKRKSLYKLMESNVTISENYSEPVSEQCLLLDPKEELKQTRAEIKRLKDDNQLMKKEIQEIEKIEEEKKLAELEVAHLKAEVQKSNQLLNTFLCDDQILALNKPPRKWANKTIVKGLKMRFALGVHGYDYLRETKYPLPAYSTLTRRLCQFKLNFGVFNDLLDPLKHKVSCMEESDKFCCMSVDEMEISPHISFDKNRREMFGGITIGNSTKVGNKLLVVLIRGVKHTWKQIIGVHVTDGAVNNEYFKNFIFECINFVESCGIQVLSLSSDMGNSNRALWKVLGIQVKKEGIRENKFFYNGHYIKGQC